MKERICYLDLDGVLANFVKGIEKKSGKRINKLSKQEIEDLYTEGNFFEELPLIVGAKKFFDYCDFYFDNLEILTSVGDKNTENVIEQKKRWVNKHFGDYKINTVTTSKYKAEYAHDNAILVDDREKSVIPFREAGGHSILFKSFGQTLNELDCLLYNYVLTGEF